MYQVQLPSKALLHPFYLIRLRVQIHPLKNMHNTLENDQLLWVRTSDLTKAHQHLKLCFVKLRKCNSPEEYLSFHAFAFSPEVPIGKKYSKYHQLWRFTWVLILKIFYFNPPTSGKKARFFAGFLHWDDPSSIYEIISITFYINFYSIPRCNSHKTQISFF